MRRSHLAVVMNMASILAVTMACGQAPVAAPAWMDAASWGSVHPVATRNIVYANVPVPGNPSANPNPGLAGGGMPRIANSPNAARTARLLGQRERGKLKANPQIVADGIAAILDDPRPRLRYVFGFDAHLGLALKRLLPSRVLEWLLIKVSGIGA